MRTIAILMVLFSHLLLFSPSQNLITVQLAPLFGYLGVETFLVLSGFLIGNKIYARMVLQDKFSWTEALQTLKQRGWRTLPNYFLALLIAIIIGFWFQYSEDNLWKYFFLVQNFTSPMPLFYSESWSLTIGFFGNVILISGMFLVINRLHFKNKSRAFLIGIVFIIMISLVCKLFYYLMNSTTTLLQWDTNLFWDVLYLPLTSIAIAFLLPTFSQYNFEGILKKSITFISKISFAVYLIHYSIILQLMSHFLVPKLYTTTEFCFFSICYLVITLLFGFIFYHFYERPLSNRSIKN